MAAWRNRLSPQEETVTVLLRLPFDDSRALEVTGSSRDESIPAMISRTGGWYEPWVMRALRDALPGDGIAIDIGANLGAIALALSALAPKGQVFAFEPVPETFAFLKRNLEANRITNVFPVNAGVFSSPGLLEFHYVEEFAGGAFLSPLGVSDRREKRTSVECVTLDSFVAERGLTRVDVIKIDVEGAEDDVLAGASKTCRDLVPTLVIEFNPKTSELFFGRTLEGLYQRLVEWNYSLSMIERPTGSLWKVTDYPSLMERIAKEGGVGDVLCIPGRQR